MSRWTSVRRFCSRVPPPEHPVRRAVRIAKNDVKKFVNHVTDLKLPYENYASDRTYYDSFPKRADVLIVGGGIMGLAAAYFIKARAGKGLEVAVVERDPTYSTASTVLSVGGLRQQFSLRENVLMSRFAAEFFRDVRKTLGADVDLQFAPHGYLLLATEATADTLRRNHETQRELGVKNALMSRRELRNKFPWLNADGIELGCLGLEDEGWFDPWSLLYAFKRKIAEMGVRYAEAEVIGFTFKDSPDIQVVGVPAGQYRRLKGVVVRRREGDASEIEFSEVVLAAGAASGALARLAGIGVGEGPLSFPLPVEPRKRYVYCFSCPDVAAPGPASPLTIDASGTYFRREGSGATFIAGRAPSPGEEPPCDTLDVDHGFFESDVWPRLAERVPAFAGVKVNGAWAGYYEFNTFDENGIIGYHPYHLNMLIATGFSGHGIQQGPAVGRALAELVMDGEFTTIDLRRLGFDRFLMDLPMYETNIF